MICRSIRPLADNIPRRKVITSHEDISSVTNNSRTPNFRGTLPNNLRIVSTHFTTLTSITPITIILLFTSPGAHCVHRSPRAPTSPVYVFPQLEIVFRERMDQLTVSLSLPGPPLCVLCQLGVPYHWWFQFSCPD